MAFKPFDLTGKAAVITGGNGGIGLGMAEGLAAAGADIAIWGRNADKNAAALERLTAWIDRYRLDAERQFRALDGVLAQLSDTSNTDTTETPGEKP